MQVTYVAEDYWGTLRDILGVYVCYIYVNGQDRVYDEMNAYEGGKAICGLPVRTG